MSRYEIEQEKIEADEQARHEARTCDGLPCCAYCLDDWEEANREEFDRVGYYDSKGHWVK